MFLVSDRKASKDEEIITMAKSLIKSWKKLVPESSDKKEKEKEKKEEKKEEKEKPAPKSSFTPNSFSGTGSFFCPRSRCSNMFGRTCCNFPCAGTGTVCNLHIFFLYPIIPYAIVPGTSFMNGR